MAAPPDAVVAEPPPDAVVAVLLLELSLPQAARTVGASATAAPATPRRVSTCRRVTRPSCTGRCGSFSVIPTAPCVVAEYPARHVQRNSRRARFTRSTRSGRHPMSDPSRAVEHAVFPLCVALPHELRCDASAEPQPESSGLIAHRAGPSKAPRRHDRPAGRGQAVVYPSPPMPKNALAVTLPPLYSNTPIWRLVTEWVVGSRV